MDYSSSIHDADNPAGASPWGSSPTPSPQHNRSTFGTSTGDAPPPMSPYGDQQAGSNAGYHNDHDTMGSEHYNRPESAGSMMGSNGDNHRPDTAESEPDVQQQSFVGKQQQVQGEQAQQQPQEHQQNAPTSRQGSRPQGPQYKLQAKITGLERTGRKDPILRFDVHVRTFVRCKLGSTCRMLTICRPIYPRSEQLSSETYDGLTLNLSNLPNISYLLVPKPLYLQFHRQ